MPARICRSIRSSATAVRLATSSTDGSSTFDPPDEGTTATPAGTSVRLGYLGPQRGKKEWSMLCFGAKDPEGEGRRKRVMRLVVRDLGSEEGLRMMGELDLSSAPHLSEALDPMLERGGRIVLDVSELTFMDSTGLQVLIRSALSLGDRGTIVLRDPGNLVRSILELAIRTDKIPNLRIEGEEEAPAARE